MTALCVLRQPPLNKITDGSPIACVGIDRPDPAPYPRVFPIRTDDARLRVPLVYLSGTASSGPDPFCGSCL